MKNYRCLIVDDERLAQELLETYVQKIPYLNLVGTASTAIEAMRYLQEETIDLLFLDIQMPNLTGIDFLRMLPNPPATIFTTAYSEYALEGYELGVVDYLLKPIEFDRFFKAVTKVTQQRQQPIPTPIAAPQTALEDTPNYCFVKSDTKIVRIDFAELLYVEALQKYSRLFTTKERIITLLSLSKIEELLPPHFVRIHRSYIVNIQKIEQIEGNRVQIQGQQLPISKGKRDDFLALVREQGWF